MNTLTKPGRRSVLTPWSNPFDRFFRNDFVDLWDDDFPSTIPSINVAEENDHYRIEMAAPGLKKNDFNIDMDGNIITISCKKESTVEDGGNGDRKGNKDKKGNYTRREYNYSSFSRSFTLPENANPDKISAKYNEGILQLQVPKKEQTIKQNGKKIEVQ
jgi:HSP20 family protein